jgi:ectoine hydroxylase-related dioxygenase (phytanoyl-CoA dioxygenase family)
MPAPAARRQLASDGKSVKLGQSDQDPAEWRLCLSKVKTMNRVDATQVQDFQQDGAVALRGLFREWVEPLRTAIERNIAAPSAGARIYPAEDGSGLFFGDYCNWNRFAEYADFLRHSALAETAAQLMGARTVRLFHEHVLVKEPGTDMPTPWHHDQP